MPDRDHIPAYIEDAIHLKHMTTDLLGKMGVYTIPCLRRLHGELTTMLGFHDDQDRRALERMIAIVEIYMENEGTND